MSRRQQLLKKSASKKSAAAAGGGSSPTEDQFMAAAIGDAEWLRQSLRASDSPDAKDRNGLAAVHLAAIHGRLDCLRLMIEHFKVDANTASSTGWRPVHLCISAQTGSRAMQCLVYLLDKGADHSCLNDDLVTPVHQAASEGHLQALQLLIKLGAKLDQVDARGFRPIDMAKIWGHKKCARLLATETWHRNKDQLAKKLGMEKRVAMKELLRQFEREERIAGDMRYQGNQAFDEWVQQVEESKSGSHQRRHRKKQSQSPPRPQPPQDADARMSLAERHREPSDISAEFSAARSQVREAIAEADEVLAATPHSARAHRSPGATARLAWHPQDWNPSTKATACFHPYQPMLADVYPRDVFTRMPHPSRSQPLWLNARSGHPAAALASDADRRAMRRVGREAAKDDATIGDEDDGDEDVVGHQEVEAGRREQQLFACKSVLDIQRRKRLAEAARKFRGEATAHLSSDVRSFLFRDALGLEPPQEPSPAPPSVGGEVAASKSTSTVGSRGSSNRGLGSPQRLLSPQLRV